MISDMRALAVATRAMQPFNDGQPVPWSEMYRVVHEVAKEVWGFMRAENEELKHELDGVKSANEYMGRLHKATCDRLDALRAEADDTPSPPTPGYDRNPRIAGGKPCIRGTRVPLSTVLRALAGPGPLGALAADGWDHLDSAAVAAALHAAAEEYDRMVMDEGGTPPPVGRDPGPSSGTPTTGLGVCYRCGRVLRVAEAAWMPDGRPIHPGCEPVGRDAGPVRGPAAWTSPDG